MMMMTMMVVVVMMAREMHGKAAIPQAGSRRSVCTSLISLSSKAAPTSSSPSPFVVVVITIMFNNFVLDDHKRHVLAVERLLYDNHKDCDDNHKDCHDGHVTIVMTCHDDHIRIAMMVIRIVMMIAVLLPHMSC